MLNSDKHWDNFNDQGFKLKRKVVLLLNLMSNTNEFTMIKRPLVGHWNMLQLIKIHF